MVYCSNRSTDGICTLSFRNGTNFSNYPFPGQFDCFRFAVTWGLISVGPVHIQGTLTWKFNTYGKHEEHKALKTRNREILVFL